jgi:hypothetical protein
MKKPEVVNFPSEKIGSNVKLLSESDKELTTSRRITWVVPFVSKPHERLSEQPAEKRYA